MNRESEYGVDIGPLKNKHAKIVWVYAILLVSIWRR